VSNHGVIITPPTIANGEIALNCPGATRIRFLTELGLAQVTEGDDVAYAFDGCEWYVRAEVIGDYTEAFDAALDTTNRWGIKGGSWSVGGGLLAQQTDQDVEQQILLKRHLTGEWRAEVDVTLPAHTQQQQAGILLNALNHDYLYYF